MLWLDKSQCKSIKIDFPSGSIYYCTSLRFLKFSYRISKRNQVDISQLVRHWPCSTYFAIETSHLSLIYEHFIFIFLLLHFCNNSLMSIDCISIESGTIWIWRATWATRTIKKIWIYRPYTWVGRSNRHKISSI